MKSKTSKSKRHGDAFDMMSGESEDSSSEITNNPTQDYISSDENVLDIDVMSMAKEDQFAFIFSFCKSKEDFSVLMNSFMFVKERKLEGQFRKACNDIESYWNAIESFSHVEEDYRIELLTNISGVTSTNNFEAIRRSLWINASQNLSLGVDPSTFNDVEDLDELMIGILQDVPKFIRDAKSFKIKCLENVFDAICNCFPKKVVAGLTTSILKFKFIEDLIRQFNNGKFPKYVNPLNYKVPSEAGVLLPHTMDAKEWIAASVALVMNDIMGDEYAISFQSSDVQDVRLYHGRRDEYLLFDEDIDSPFHIDTSPILFCPSVKGQPWVWRDSSTIVSAKVNLRFKTNDDLNDDRDDVRTQELKALAYEFATTYTESAVRLGVHSLPFVKVVESNNLHRKSFVLSFYKRGYSSKNDVGRKSEFIHIVKLTTSADISTTAYHHILLSDLQSVLLIPTELWNVSKFMGKKTGKPYNTRFGISKLTSPLTTYQLFLAFYRLSHTFEMFSCWENSKAYSYSAYSEVLMFVLSSSVDAGFTKLKGGSSKSFNPVLRLVSSVSQGAIRGLWVSPLTTKIGKLSVTVMEQDHRFNKELDSLDFGDKTVKASKPRTESTIDDESELNKV